MPPTPSMTPTIQVLRPGTLTLVQDLGRPGYGASGVPRGGAFDPWAARAANRLVGNPDSAAVLEITLDGPTLELEGVAAIALVGDPFTFEIGSGEESALRSGGHDRTLLLPPQTATRITLGRAAAGVRAWLAFAGGLDVPIVLGSRSTDLGGRFGGFAGRALCAGDELRTLPAASESLRRRRRERPGAAGEVPPLRIVPGPDARLLPAPGLSALAGVERPVSPHSDRRGLRLGGEPLKLEPSAPLRSQGTLPGAVQLPPSGRPIVLGVDAPVTGGYPWVAQVIEADLDLLAHLAPGAPVRFELVDFPAAELALDERLRQFTVEIVEE